jgi:hypothetical protein
MSKDRFNSVPIIVQQMVSNLSDKSLSTNVKFNNAQMVRNIRDYCDLALTDYDKKVIWDSKTGKK